MPKNINGYAKHMKSGQNDTQMYHESEYKAKMYSSSYANMPTEVVQKNYEKDGHGLDGYYNDNIYGIDAFSKQNAKKVNKQINMPYKS